MGAKELSHFIGDDKNVGAIEKSFISAIYEQGYPMCYYHGTDRFVLNTSDEDRVRYTNAFKRYIQAVLERVEINTIKDCVDENEPSEEDTLLFLTGIKNGSTNHQYRSLYVTGSPDKAEGYADRARFFGEIGFVAYNLRNIAKRFNWDIHVEPEVEELLDAVFNKITENDAEPVFLKLKPEFGDDKIVSMEDGTNVNFARELRLFFCSGEVQDSFRLADGSTLADFIEIDLDEEAKDMQRRSEKLRKEYQTYYNNYLIEAFGPITESEKRKLVLFGYLFEEE